MDIPDEPVRRYVDVIARWREDGRVTPLSVCWPDGRSFQIDRVIGDPTANSFDRTPGRVLRYTVRIGAHTTHLYLESEGSGSKDSARWFVMAHPQRQPWRFG